MNKRYTTQRPPTAFSTDYALGIAAQAPFSGTPVQEQLGKLKEALFDKEASQ